MIDVATHIRIFDANPTDDFVTKRIEVIKNLSDSYKKKGTPEPVLQLAHGLVNGVAAKGALPQALVEEIEAALKKVSPSFVKEGQDLQILVCGLLAALTVIDGAKSNSSSLSRTDLLAAGLWSGLSFQPARAEPKVEALRLELLTKCHELVMATASVSRNRVPVPSFSISISESPDAPTLEKLLKTGTEKTIEALKTNAALDREELDLLWWVLSNYSNILDKKFSDLSHFSAAVVSGIEVAQYIRRLPSDTHKHLALRNVAQEEITLADLIKNLGEHKSKLIDLYKDNSTLSSAYAVFPLLASITINENSLPEAKGKKALSEWSGRALIEASILHIITVPNAVI
jgi:hypothetical protein